MEVELKGWNEYLLSTFEWITRLAYLNFLWIGFTLLGFGLFGFFPATAAMFKVVRTWLKKSTDIATMQTFWTEYRQNFKQINIIGFVYIIIGILLYVDFKFFQASHLILFNMISIFILIAAIIYVIACLYLFPMYAHFQLTTFEYIKYPFLYTIGRPIQALMLLGVFIATFLIFYFIPGF